VVESGLEEPLKTQYSAAAKMWSQIRREFLYAIEQARFCTCNVHQPFLSGPLPIDMANEGAI